MVKTKEACSLILELLCYAYLCSSLHFKDVKIIFNMLVSSL